MNQLLHNGYVFDPVAASDMVSLYYCSELSFVICTAQAEYIPIEAFREVFLRISGIIREHSVKHLLFDKRALRTFHQPSMEWYFTIWKPSVGALGLTNHFKILPELEWFREAVRAGKHELFSKFGEDFLAGITITYVNNEEEAIDAIIATGT